MSRLSAGQLPMLQRGHPLGHALYEAGRSYPYLARLEDSFSSPVCLRFSNVMPNIIFPALSDQHSHGLMRDLAWRLGLDRG